MLKILLLAFFVLVRGEFARAECGSPIESIAPRVLTTSDQKVLVIQSYSHFVDGPGYVHYAGTIEFFGVDGASIGKVRVSYDEDPDNEDSSEDEHDPKTKAKIKLDCGKLRPVQETKALRNLCRSPEKTFSLREPKNVRALLEHMITTLNLNEVAKIQLACKAKIKIIPASHRAEEEDEQKPAKWGLLQILYSDSVAKEEFSIYRIPLAPDVYWDAKLEGCPRFANINAVIVNYKAYAHCGGEGERSFLVVPSDTNIIEAARLNVIGLRQLKQEKHQLASETFLKSIQLDRSNELAHYNLASAMALMGKKSAELKPHLKAYTENLLKKIDFQYVVQDLPKIFRQELLKKMSNDPDLKNLDRPFLEKIVSEAKDH